MAVKIRLKRMGAKKAPFYRIVVADSRSPCAKSLKRSWARNCGTSPLKQETAWDWHNGRWDSACKCARAPIPILRRDIRPVARWPRHCCWACRTTRKRSSIAWRQDLLNATRSKCKPYRDHAPICLNHMTEQIFMMNLCLLKKAENRLC